MKRDALMRITTTALLAAASLFAACSFETDGDFEGLVAGVAGNLPRAPNNVQVMADDNGGINFRWEERAEADGYIVYRTTSSDITRFVRRGSTGGTSYTDSGPSVPPDTPFYYRVSAYNSKGVSAYSEVKGPVSAYRNPVILSAPVITGAAASTSSITVMWTAVGGAKGYILYRSSAFDGEIYIFRTTAESLQYADAALEPGIYTYQVRAFDDGGKGIYPMHPIRLR